MTSVNATVDQIVTLIEKEEELMRLRRYEDLAFMITGEQLELSHHKVEDQRNNWRKVAKLLLEEDYPQDNQEPVLYDNF